MPFLALCECGLTLEGHCGQNAYLALAPEVRHLHFENGSLSHDSPVQIRSVPIRQYGYKHIPACHPSETVAYWFNPKTGQVRRPGRNDVPLPDRYQRWGFERRELRTLREIERHEREHGSRNERIWFDKGSGRDFDTNPF